jgi:hypothetical protein|nr:hypothetical protein [uncultured Flavobacterium sp.]
MEKKDSIKLLNAQKNKLNEKSLDEIHWIDETTNIVSNIFGKDSDQLKQLKQIKITIHNSSHFTYEGEDRNPMKNRIRAINYIDSFITQVENFTYKKLESYDRNTECKFNKNIFYSVSFIIVSGAFTLGFYFGNNKFDREKIELSDKVKFLTSDSIRLTSKIKKLEILLKNQEPK